MKLHPQHPRSFRNPDQLTDWTLDSQGNWVDSLGVTSPTGGDHTTDGNVNFFDLTTRRGGFRTLPRYAGGGQGGGPPSLVKQPLANE